MLDYNALKPHDLSHLVDARIGNPDADLTNVIVNGDFADWTGDDPDIWSAPSEDADNYVTEAVGGCRIVSDGSIATQIRQSVLTTGKSYIGKVDVLSVDDTNGIAFGTNTAVNNIPSALNINTVGTHYFNFVAGSEQFRIKRATSSVDITFTNVEVYEWSGEELDKTGWGTYSGGVVTGSKDDGYVLTCDGSAWSGMTTDDNIITSATEKFYLSITIKRVSGDAGEILYFGSSQVSEAFQIIPTTEYITFTSESISFPTTGKFFLLGNTNTGVYSISQMSVKKITGLVAAYNMIPSPDGVLVDISGEGYNGTIINMVSTKNGLATFRSNPTGQISWLTPIMDSITLWSFHVAYSDWYSVPGNEFFIGGASNRNFLLDSSGHAGFRASDGLYYQWDGTGNTVACTSSILGDGLKDVITNIVVTSDGTNIHLYADGIYYGYVTPATTEFTLSEIVKGYSGDTLSVDEINMIDFKVFNYHQQIEQAQAYHNQFAQRISQRHNFDDLGVGSTI